MEAYERNVDKGWDSFIQKIKVNIEKMPPSSRVVGYYLNGEPKTITRRVRRIVREALKEAASGTSTSNCVQTNPNAADGASGAARSVIDRQNQKKEGRTGWQSLWRQVSQTKVARKQGLRPRKNNPTGGNDGSSNST